MENRMYTAAAAASCSASRLLTELMSQLSAAFSGNDPFVVKIALVADKNNLRIVPRVRLDLRTPEEHKRRHRLTGFNVCQHEDNEQEVRQARNAKSAGDCGR